MRKNLFIIGALIALGTASCSEDVYKESRNESFTKNFMEVFGVIDSEQDWNMAEKNSVTVNPGSSSEVFIYTPSGDNYKLAGHYTNLSGEKELFFDAVEGCESVVVSNGFTAKMAAPGQNVDLSIYSSRALLDSSKGVYTRDAEATEFSGEAVREFLKYLPEGGDNTKVNGLVSNYSAIQKATPTKVYPIYWNTQSTITVGIYYKDPSTGELIEEDIYCSGDAAENDDITYTLKGSDKRANFRSPSSTSTECTDGNLAKIDKFYSKGVTLNLPEGQEFGFYIRAQYTPDKYDAKYYTEAGMNGNNGSMASYRKVTLANGTERTFVAFDDWNAPARDLNDFVLILDPAPIVIDHTEHEFIFACEDLGGDDDFDFNDVVFSLKYVAGQQKASIKALAAGGVLPVQILFNGEPIGPEFHKWFGDNIASSQMVNTTPGKNHLEGREIEFEIPKDFSITGTGSTVTNGNINGISLCVNGSTVIKAPGKGTAPQMIVVPSDWLWPTERTSINKAYPSFGDWGAHYSNNEWHGNYVTGNVYKR